MISSICSVPIDNLTVFSKIPTVANSSLVISEWVVDAGWITNDLTSATLARSEKIFKLSINFFVSSSVPLTLNVNIDPPPLGKYFLYNACWSLSLEIDGWFTFSTLGCFSKYLTTFKAFSICLSTLNDKVSSPCNAINAFTGEMAAPVSLNNIALI